MHAKSHARLKNLEIDDLPRTALGPPHSLAAGASARSGGLFQEQTIVGWSYQTCQANYCAYLEIIWAPKRSLQMACNRFSMEKHPAKGPIHCNRVLNGRRGGTGNDLDGLPCRISREMEPAEQPGCRSMMGAISATRRRSNDAEFDFLTAGLRGTQPFNGDDANVWINVEPSPVLEGAKYYCSGCKCLLEDIR